MTSQHPEAHPHQRPEERRHDGVEPQRPREAEEEEVESNVVPVLDDEDEQHAEPRTRGDRTGAELSSSSNVLFRWSLLAHEFSEPSGAARGPPALAAAPEAGRRPLQH